MTVEEIKKNLVEKLNSNFGCEISDATDEQLYKAVALTVRDEIMQRRTESRGVRKAEGAKKVYYLSAEFLEGRSLFSNMVNLVNEKNYIQALEELGIDRGRDLRGGAGAGPRQRRPGPSGGVLPGRAVLAAAARHGLHHPL